MVSICGSIYEGACCSGQVIWSQGGWGWGWGQLKMA